MEIFRKKLVFIVLTSLIVFLNSVFIVNQWNQAIILQFGESVRVIKDAGLHFKVPFIQNVNFFDKRILNYNLKDQEIQAKDKKRIIVSAFVKYQIADSLKFYQAIGVQGDESTRLNSILDSSLRQVIGQNPMINLLSHDRIKMMQSIEDIVSEKSKRFGIDIIDVRILRADLPKENSDAIYQRMKSDREMEAKEYRAQGVEESNIIKSQADKEVKIIYAEADKQSEIIRGNGDAIATKNYAEAYNLDKDFYEFSKSMQVYEEGLKKENTKMVLTPESNFMKYFNGSIN